MKMKRNNKTDARPGEKGARSFRRSCRMVALSVLAAVVVALFGAAPAFADTTTSGPAIDKTVKELQDAAGNVYGGRISLSVTGSASSTTTKTKANVIFVVDVSRSMNDDYSLAKDDGGAYSKDDKDLAYFCQSKWGGRSGYVTIRNYNDNSDYYDYYYTVYKSVIYELTLYADGTIADATKYTGDRYKHVAQSQTRLAAAQSAIRTAANSIIGQGNAKVSLVKFSDTASVVVNHGDAPGHGGRSRGAPGPGPVSSGRPPSRPGPRLRAGFVQAGGGGAEGGSEGEPEVGPAAFPGIRWRHSLPPPVGRVPGWERAASYWSA